jgi:hypothetical protein
VVLGLELRAYILNHYTGRFSEIESLFAGARQILLISASWLALSVILARITGVSQKLLAPLFLFSLCRHIEGREGEEKRREGGRGKMTIQNLRGACRFVVEPSMRKALVPSPTPQK